MSTQFKKFPKKIEQQALDWFTLVQSGHVSDSESLALNDWLADNEQHRHAYEQLERIWQHVGDLALSEEAQALRESVENTSLWEQCRQVLFMPLMMLREILGWFLCHRLVSFLAVSFTIFVAVFVLLSSPKNVVSPDYYATGVGEVRTIILSDGSEIVLGARSTMTVSISNKERSVLLTKGEAFFNVAKDSVKPFFVNVNEVVVRVVGTQFDVRKRYGATSVGVLEGVVSVTALDSETVSRSLAPITLVAGEQVTKVDTAGFSDIKQVSPVELGMWRHGRLVYRNVNLIDVILDANRYFDGNISLLAKDLEHEKITVTFKTDQIEQLPSMLSQTLPIKVIELTDGRFLLDNLPREL